MDTMNRPLPSVARPSTGIHLLSPEQLRDLRRRYERLLRQFGTTPGAAYSRGVIAAIDLQLRQESA
jgi:hypothetical protein